MISRRPYLIRALYEWLVDAGEVPHLLVDATLPGVLVPEEFVQDGRIVLNVGAGAVQSLQMGNEEFSFSARFQGTPRIVRFPPVAVIAIYGRESGQGMMFGPEDAEEDDAGEQNPQGDATAPQDEGDTDRKPGKSSKPGKPSLKIIK